MRHIPRSATIRRTAGIVSIAVAIGLVTYLALGDRPATAQKKGSPQDQVEAWKSVADQAFRNPGMIEKELATLGKRDPALAKRVTILLAYVDVLESRVGALTTLLEQEGARFTPWPFPGPGPETDPTHLELLCKWDPLMCKCRKGDKGACVSVVDRETGGSAPFSIDYTKVVSVLQRCSDLRASYRGVLDAMAAILADGNISYAEYRQMEQLREQEQALWEQLVLNGCVDFRFPVRFPIRRER